MEESITLLENLKKAFSCEHVDIKTYSPLTLAYIGDAIYDVFIRSVAVARGNRSAAVLHKTVSTLVKAETQARLIHVLREELTEEETIIYKRGRNAKSRNSAKNASLGEYQKATGFEALLGYLYLSGHTNRAIELVKMGMDKLELTI